MPRPPVSPAPLDDDDFDRIHAERRRARRKALWWLFGGFALLFALFAYAFIADEPPPDTSDLRVEFKRPPEDQNAYALLTKLVATLPAEPSDATPEERHFARIFSAAPEEQVTWNQDVVATVLGRYPPDLADKVRVALAAPESEAPEIKSYTDLAPEIRPLRHLSYALTRQATLAWHSGDHDTAADLNLLALHLGQRISQSQGGLITVLTATAIQGISLESIRRHVAAPAITPDALRRYVEKIGLHELQIDAYQTAYKLDHLLFAHTARDLKAQGPSTLAGGKSNKALDSLLTLPGIYQPNRTIRWNAEQMRLYIARTEPLPPGVNDPAAMRFQSIAEAPLYRRLPNPTGWTFLVIATPSLGKVTTTAHRVRANLRLTRLYAALRLYQLERDGALPADLTELVPAYLPTIPLDPFGGQPLRYDRALTTIWSIDQKYLTITDADGDFPEHGMPAFRLLFARPPIELPPYVEDPEPAP